MWKCLLLASLVLAIQSPGPAQKKAEFGTISGSIVPPDKASVRQQIQVLLIPPQYVDYFDADAQTRNDNYWERYKPAFLQKKELFLDVQKTALKESMQAVAAKMQRELGTDYARYHQATTADGKFEFRNFPVGMYKVLAVGVVSSNVEYVWQETVVINSSVPQFIPLKKHFP